MECHDARQLLDRGTIPGSADPQRARLGFHLAGCPACRAYRARSDEQLLLRGLLAQQLTVPRRAPLARRRSQRPLRIAGATLMVSGALALATSVSVVPASAAAAPAPASQPASSAALLARADSIVAADRSADALLESLLMAQEQRAGARAERQARARKAEAELLRSLLEERPVSTQEKAALARARSVALAPLVAGVELVLPQSPALSTGGQAAQTSYTVRSGDCLWTIAIQMYGDGTFWTAIYEANKPTIGNNPNLIYPNQVFTIPPKPARPPVVTPSSNANNAARPGLSYTIVRGDTLSGIAFAAYGNANRWPDIYRANAGVIGGNPHLIFPGTVLVLPS